MNKAGGREVWVVAAGRSPIGRFMGGLAPLSAVQIASQVVASLVASCGLEPTDVGECILGNVIGAGLGQNPAKQVVLGSGLSESVSAYCINKVCSSGLKAIGLAADDIAMGREEIVVAGGMESMSNAPHVLRGVRSVAKLGDISLAKLAQRLTDAGGDLGELTACDEMLLAGLVDAYSREHMGVLADLSATELDVPREQQDAYAAESHRRAWDALNSGAFDHEIVPITLPDGTILGRDEGIRPGTSTEGLSGLRAAFTQDGSVTAGNASQLSDGAAAVVLMSPEAARARGLEPLASIVGYSSVGGEPDRYGVAPVQAVRKLLGLTGLATEEIDLVEINEAFCVSTLAVMKQLGLGSDRVNVNGGAIALGHPIGASGARVFVTLAHALRRRDARYGIATLCHGGGGADAVALKRVVEG